MTRRRRNADDRLRRSERELGGGGDPWEVLRQQLRAGTARSVEITGWPGIAFHPHTLAWRRAWFSPPGLLLLEGNDSARIPYPFKLMDEGEVRRVGQHTVRVETPIGTFGDLSWTGGLAGFGNTRPEERLQHYVFGAGNALLRPLVRPSVAAKAARDWPVTTEEIPLLAEELEGLPHHELRLFDERNREWPGGRRPNPDERMRRLERAAAAGDAEAQAQLDQMRYRMGEAPQPEASLRAYLPEFRDPEVMTAVINRAYAKGIGARRDQHGPYARWNVMSSGDLAKMLRTIFKRWKIPGKVKGVRIRGRSFGNYVAHVQIQWPEGAHWIGEAAFPGFETGTSGITTIFVTDGWNWLNEPDVRGVAQPIARALADEVYAFVLGTGRPR